MDSSTCNKYCALFSHCSSMVHLRVLTKRSLYSTYIAGFNGVWMESVRLAALLQAAGLKFFKPKL